MPHIDDFLQQTEKKEKKSVTVIFDEDDSILDSIKLMMHQHNLSEVTVLGAEGNIKNALLSAPSGRFSIENKPILLASGTVKLSYGDLYGGITVSTHEKPPLKGVLVRGTAGNNLKMDFSFFSKN